MGLFGAIKRLFKWTAIAGFALIVAIVGLYLIDTSFDGDGINKPPPGTITPARDISGIWTGTTSFESNEARPSCIYKGTIILDLKQMGNVLTGTYEINSPSGVTTTAGKSRGIECRSGRLGAFVQGKVSSSRIDFTGITIVFSGSFTTDLMTLNFESCPNQQCKDGSKNVGWVGTAKLTRQS